MTKWCRRCYMVKPVSDFNLCAGNNDDLQSYCRECSKEVHKEVPKERRRVGTLRLPKEEYQRYMQEAGNQCANRFCNADTNLVLDHDHTTGTVRGVLCNTCNIALGMTHDSIFKLQGLIEYLERDGSNQEV